MATAKVYVFSDSVLCVGRMGDNPIESWKNHIQWYSEHKYFNELNRIDGKPMEFEWKDSPMTHNSGYPQRDSEIVGRLHRQDHLHVNVQ